MSGEETRRDLILDAAGRAFGRYGFRKTSITDIVREAGVARATVYNYFSTKDEIFDAVVHREISEMIRKVREAVAEEKSTRERLRTAVLTHIREIQEKVNVFRLTRESLDEMLPRTHDVAEGLSEEIVSVYRWIVSEGVKSGEIVVEDIDSTAWTILLAFKGVFITTMSGQIRERMPGLVDSLLEILWNGLKPREEGT